MRIRKLTRAKKSTPRSKKSALAAKAIRTQAIFLVVVGIVAAAAMLFAAGQSSRPSQVAIVDGQSDVSLPTSARRSSAADTSKTAAMMVKTTLASDTTVESAPPVDLAARPAGPALAPVTITGCLEQSRDGFRLKDTTGVDAAKSRSWKSGFFKKSSASIEVVDAANRLKLTTHVGQRVSVTGVIVDREMQGRSLKRIAASCDIEPVRGTGLKTVARGL
jgi:hypothetical protein